MGNIIKINLYAEAKKRKGAILNIKNLESNIVNYNNWLQKNSREDRIETYEEYLQVK